jgi:Fe-S-cluster containining protein
MSQLCLDCGLCCNGTLFSHALIYPRDLSKGVPQVPAQISVQRRSEKLFFYLPCPAHDAQAGCTVYDARPIICRGFECKLLQAHSAGKIDLDRAREIVAQTKARAAALEKQVGPPTEESHSLSRRVLAFARKSQADPTTTQVPDSFAGDALAFHQLINEHFHDFKSTDPGEDSPMPDPGT